MTTVAQWKARGGKRYLTLERYPTDHTLPGNSYRYQGDGQAGQLGVFSSDAMAIAWFESHQVKVLQWDFPSLKRVA